MTDLPDEIMVWRSMEKLTHIGTWATERYPDEAVAYIPRADAEAAMAAVVERAAKDLDERGQHEQINFGLDRATQNFYRARDIVRAFAPPPGLAMLAELRAERDAADQRAGAMLARIVALEADGAAARSAASTNFARAEAAETERDNLSAANAALEAKLAGLDEHRASAMLRRDMNAPEDPHVEALCERYGYGAVMDAASRLWARKDSMGAFYIGGCIGMKTDREARAALATQEAGTC